MNRTASMILGLALAACGGPKEPAAPTNTERPTTVDVAPTATETAPAETAAPATASAAPATTPPIGLAPFTLTLDEAGKPAKKLTIDVTADGAVKGPKDKMLAFAGNELRDDKGEWITRVLADGTVEVKSVHVSKRNGKVEKEETQIKPIGKFGTDDELTIDKGGSLRVGDDGAIVVKGVDPKLDPTKGMKMSFKGVNAQSRRAATVLFISIFAGTRSESDMTDVQGTPATPAAPPKK